MSTDNLKIMVIDDSPWNIASAKLTLAGYNITTIDNVSTAFEVLSKGLQGYSALLTDIYLPQGNFRGALAENIVASDKVIPAGIVFALTAIHCGVPTIICSDSDHHQDVFASLLDLIQHCKIAERKLVFVEARTVPLRNEEVAKLRTQPPVGTLVKDWYEAIQRAGVLPEMTHMRFSCIPKYWEIRETTPEANELGKRLLRAEAGRAKSFEAERAFLAGQHEHCANLLTALGF